MPHSFEDYGKKASTYTSMRRAIGLKELTDFLGLEKVNGKTDENDAKKRRTDGKKASELQLFDSGCGTGNYAAVLIRDYGIRHLHCSDYSTAMLDCAKQNVNVAWREVKEQEGDVKLDIKFTQDDVCDMGEKVVPSGAFDFCINNQVVHHLRGDNDFADLKRAGKEWFRLLKPGGKLAINFCEGSANPLPGMWWSELIPTALAAWNKRAPTLDAMRTALEEAGFAKDSIQFVPIKDEILYDVDMYFDPMNFVKDPEHFARSDSTFNLCPEGELAAAVKKLKDMGIEAEKGSEARKPYEEWWASKEKIRLEHGQTVTVFATKA